MTDKQTRFGFTSKHFTLLGLVTPNAHTFVDNAPDAANVSSACSEASVCAANNFPTLLA